MLTTPQFFKCLSDDTRLLSILLIRQQGELCVCELMQALEQSQPKISRHLAQLRACGLLKDRRDKQWVYYDLPTDLPNWAGDILDAGLAAEGDRIKSSVQRLKAMTDRPARCC